MYKKITEANLETDKLKADYENEMLKLKEEYEREQESKQKLEKDMAELKKHYEEQMDVLKKKNEENSKINVSQQEVLERFSFGHFFFLNQLMASFFAFRSCFLQIETITSIDGWRGKSG